MGLSTAGATAALLVLPGLRDLSRQAGSDLLAIQADGTDMLRRRGAAGLAGGCDESMRFPTPGDFVCLQHVATLQQVHVQGVFQW